MPHRRVAFVVSFLLVVAASVTSCIGGGPKGGDAGSDASTTRSASPGAPATFPLPPTLIPPDASAPDAAHLVSPERGRELYNKYCDFCHGETGKGYAADEAPALASDDLLTLVSDDWLEGAILRGRPGTTMSSWSVSYGGPIGKNEVTALVAFLRTWQKKPLAVPAADAGAPKGDPAKGEKIYAANCASCHGAQGHGGKYNMLANPELLASSSDAFLAATIEQGRAGTPMKGFAGKLSSEQIADVVALIRSWQKPVDTNLELPPKPGELKSVVIHPKGPPPAFDPKADFVPVDTVKKEMDRGATMIILDARAPSDYARMHVAGAISVPFYDAEKYAPQIPKDRFILTYCACPHAASVKLRDAMRKLGYTKVAVLDEGILAWRDRGYPVRGGPTKP